MAACVLALITLVVFLPALGNGFINWDDNRYVYDNPALGYGFSDLLHWAFFSTVSSNWHPITMLSLALDYAVWGEDPFGFHLTNVILHAANTALVFYLSLTLITIAGTSGPSTTETPGGQGLDPAPALVAAFFTALFFSVHPLRVESVVWVSERKDLLCAFFFLLSLTAYLEYALKKSAVFYAASLTLLALALMSKPMAVSLPIVLLILDHYPLKRPLSARLITEKLPFFALSIAASIVTLFAQGSNEAVRTLSDFPIAVRVLNGAHSYVFYLYKTLLPLELAPFYPYPEVIALLDARYLLPMIAFVAVSAFCAASIRKRRLLFSVWAWYAVTLVPVIGLVQVGFMASADRYTYLPMLGPGLLLGLGGGVIYSALLKRCAAGAVPIAVTLSLTLAIAAPLIYLTNAQIRVWKEPLAFWGHQIRLFPDALALPYENRGSALVRLGRPEDALRDLDRAVEIDPTAKLAFNNRAIALSILGKHVPAQADFNRAIELDPGYAKAYYNRGLSHAYSDRFALAARDYKKALELNPEYAAPREALKLLREEGVL